MENAEKNLERKDRVGYTATEILAALTKADMQKAISQPKETVKTAIDMAVKFHDCLDEMFNEETKTEN